jgi:nitric oxide reductase subunit C
MVRPAIFIILIGLFCAYSVVIYTTATTNKIDLPAAEMKMVAEGKSIYQEYNCQACHQLFGLGGYLGPDLTNAWSDPGRGKIMMIALLQSGGNRMPDFHFNQKQIASLVTYLKYIDATSTADRTKTQALYSKK